MQIKALDAKHPTYDKEHHEDLEALFRGGRLLQARIKRFLPQNPVEPDDHYVKRCKNARYRNYFAGIVAYFDALLFTSTATIKGYDPDEVEKATNAGTAPEPLKTLDAFWNRFREDCDGRGKDLDSFFADRFEEALVGRCSYWTIDLPSDQGAPAEDRATFLERGLGDARLRRIDLDHIYDWEVDEAGALLWAIVHETKQPRLDWSRARVTTVETWTVYSRDDITTFQISYENGRRPDPDQEAPQIDRRTHRFGEVPILALDVGARLWIGERVEDPQIAHLQNWNALRHGIRTACYVTPVLKAEADRTDFSAMGWGYGHVIGVNEDLQFPSPSSMPFDVISQEVKSDKDEIFRVVHQMALGVDNNAAAIGRSGQSKASDHEATHNMLVAYAELVCEAMERTYDLISRVRDENCQWEIDGLGDFNPEDLPALVEVLTSIDTVDGGIPSPTFNAKIKARIAELMLPDEDEATKSLIRKEIEDGVKEQHELSITMRAAMAKNGPPQPPPPPGQSPQGGNEPPNPPPHGKVPQAMKPKMLPAV